MESVRPPPRWVRCVCVVYVHSVLYPEDISVGYVDTKLRSTWPFRCGGNRVEAHFSLTHRPFLSSPPLLLYPIPFVYAQAKWNKTRDVNVWNSRGSSELRHTTREMRVVHSLMGETTRRAWVLRLAENLKHRGLEFLINFAKGEVTTCSRLTTILFSAQLEFTFWLNAANFTWKIGFYLSFSQIICILCLN